MKKILVLIFTIMAVNARAQFAYEFGLDMGKIGMKLNDVSFSSKYKTGIAIGILDDIQMDNKVFFEPGLFYKFINSELTQPGGQYLVSTANVQMNIEYKTGERCGARFFAGGGLNIGYTLGGSFEYGGYGKIYPGNSGAIKVGPTREDDLKKSEVGLGLNIGYLPKKHYYFRAHYVQGLTNLKPVGDDKNVIKLSGGGLDFGYFFGSCKTKEFKGKSHSEKNNHWRGLSKGRYSTRAKYPRY